MNLSIRSKLLLGFAAVLIITAAMSLLTYVKVNSTIQINDRLTNLRKPTVLAGQTLETGLNQSLAGLRGYMILGKDPKKAEIFKKERADGWKKIDQSIASLEEFSKNWTDPRNIELLADMKKSVEGFRSAQEEVESISHTSKNIPAFDMLLTNAAPAADKVINALNNLIDKEATLSATSDRKKLLKLLADSRGSFALGLANIRAYLLSGDNKFRDNFDAKWQTNQLRLESLTRVSHLFSGNQRDDWNSYQAEREVFASYPPQMFTLRSADDWNKANYWLGTKAAPKAREILLILKQMRVSQQNLMVNDVALAKAESEFLVITLIIGMIIALLAGAAIAVFISRIICVPLSKIVTTAKSIANKDLSSVDLDESGGDEMAELSVSINRMNQTLRSVISEVLIATENVSTAANQSAQLNRQASININDQDTQTEQIATAINEMTATVQEVSRNISGTADASGQANIETDKGREIVNATVEGIHQLHKQVESAAEVVLELEKNSGGINSVMDVIKGVAEQTNLLALNAAIEAARAGEQGRGFAVVADEVRTLAGKTQTSTEEINQMIDKLQSGTREAVAVMNQSRGHAKQVADQANEAGNSLTEISNSVFTISDMSTQIASAAEEQLAVTDEINRNVISISDLSKETSVAAVQSAATSDNLLELAESLNGLIKQFKVT